MSHSDLPLDASATWQEKYLSSAEQLLERGDADAAQQQLAHLVLAKPGSNVVAKPLPETLDHLTTHRFRYALALAQAASLLGVSRASLVPLAQLMGLAATDPPALWATVLRGMNADDRPLDLARLLASSMSRNDGLELLHHFPGQTVLEHWCTSPDAYLRENAHVELLAAYIRLCIAADMRPGMDALREWLPGQCALRFKSRFQLACAVGDLEIARARPNLMRALVTTLAGIRADEWPAVNSPGFGSMDTASPEPLAELLALWLENSGAPTDLHLTLHEQIVQVLNESLKRRLEFAGPSAVVLTDHRLEPLWQRLAALLHSWVKDFASRVALRQFLACAKRLATFFEEYHNRNLAWVISYDTSLDANSEPEPSVLPSTSKSARPVAQSTETLPPTVADHTHFWMAAGLKALSRPLRLTAVGAIETRRNGDDRVRMLPMPPPGSRPTWLDDPINEDSWRELLNTHQTASRETVIWLGMHSLPTDVAVYAVELNGNELKFHLPQDGGIGASFGQLAQASEDLRRSIKRAWSRYESKQSVKENDQKYANTAMPVFANEMAAALRAHLDWVNAWLSPRLSALWQPEWNGARVLLSLSPTLQTLMPELVTINVGDDRRHLFARAQSLCRVPGFYGQRRLQKSRPRHTRDWTYRAIAGGYVPKLKDYGVIGPDVIRDKDGKEIRSPTGEGIRTLFKYVRRLQIQGRGARWLRRNEILGDRVLKVLKGRTARDVLLLLHGYPERGGVVLFDRVLDRLSEGAALEVESLLLISCEGGRLWPGPNGVTTVSRGLLAHLLAEGSRIGNLLAFGFTVPDLPAVALSLEMLERGRGACEVGGGLDLATPRHELFSELFDPAAPPWGLPQDLHENHAACMRTLLRFVLAASVVYSGATPSIERNSHEP